MKLLVLGATGMAGHVIVKYFQKAGHEVTSFSRRPLPGVPGIVGDATDPIVLHDALFHSRFDAVVNAVGILNHEAEEHQARAVQLNAWLPHYLSDLTRHGGPRVVHISTDCVFSGEKGSYTEASEPDSTTFYGRSKALGELNNERDLTYRTSIIGPDMRAEGIGLLNWFLQQKEEVNGYARVMWTGVTTITLARAIEQGLVDQLSGLYHLVNNQTISKFDLLKLFNWHLRANSMTIAPVRRPISDKSLVNKKEGLEFEVPSYDAMVAEMGDWIRDHISIYPHYSSIISTPGYEL